MSAASNTHYSRRRRKNLVTIALSFGATGLATLVGTPVGVLTGTYLAEYGRDSYIAPTVRFVNDILLSAPSIIIGLFV